MLKTGKLKTKVPTKGYSQAVFNPSANRLAVWYGNNLFVATMNGKLLADVEFVKNIHSVTCFDDGRVLVGTRYALLFNSRPEPQQVNIAAENQQQPASTTKAHLLRPSEENGLPIRWGEAQRLTIGKGKAYYKGSDGKELTIEQIVLERLRSEGCIGQWTENEYWWEIMALLFWDIIYSRIPGVYTPQFGEFPGPRQDMPIDFFKPDFYARRKV